ncbi:MAG: phosphatase PAP2 family protein [Solirubrobacteraceae bacterium]|nr:phosphatase PAP2 family protein [Solirubrobacteraceae bacterium]
MSLSPVAALRVSVAAFAFMVLLALVVRQDNAVTHADADVVTWVSGWRTPFIVDVAQAASWFGNILVLGTLAIVAGVVSAARRGRDALTALPELAVAAAALTNPLAKLAVDRPRPPAELAEVIESSTGFPSGHSAQSAAFFIGLAILIAANNRRHARWWLALGLLAALIVGLSRIVLGVHSPTDLLGGWALGLACVLLSWVALDHRAKTAPRTTKAPHERGRTDVIGRPGEDL